MINAALSASVSSWLRSLSQIDRLVDHRLVGRIFSAVLPFAPAPLVSEHLGGPGRQIDVADELGHVPPGRRAIVSPVKPRDLFQLSNGVQF
jgi:hypothetical protein